MMTMERLLFRVEPAGAGGRLDLAVARELAEVPALARRVSRSLVRAWVAEGRVRVNGRAAEKPARRLAGGDEVEILLPPPPPARPLVARDLPLAILYEDEHLLALDKPPGLVVHPSPGHHEVTLLHGLLAYSDAQGNGGPHLVSRLDRGTSGVLLVAKTPAAHTALAAALRRPDAEKDYLAVVYGRSGLPKGRIDLRLRRDPDDLKRRLASPTEGQPSATLWERLDESPAEPLALLRCRLLTGRTHQIRVHLSARGMPIVGDPVYGEPRWRGISDPVLAALCRDLPRQALHAWRLRLVHPGTGAPLEITAPVPPDLAALLSAAGLRPV
jgi:23S rRNA pseudouridine1911/1915/1917 synthase